MATSQSLECPRGPEEVSELAAIRELLALATDTCERAANGDLEARMLNCHASIETERLADSINHMLDMTDAFLREVGASLEYASRGKFFRRVILRGMRGSFRHASEEINQANSVMERDAALKESVEHRRVLADQFEGTVKKVFSELAASTARVSTATHTLGEVAGTGGAPPPAEAMRSGAAVAKSVSAPPGTTPKKPANSPR